MVFVREFLKDYFPLERFFDILNQSIEKINTLENDNDDNTWDAQDFDELRDYQYIAHINIYMQLYLNDSYSNTEKNELFQAFHTSIGPQYIDMLNEFNIETDFESSDTFKKSKLKFLLDYMQSFLKGIRKYIEIMNEEQFTKTSRHSILSETRFDNNEDGLGKLAAIKNTINRIDQSFNEIMTRLDE